MERDQQFIEMVVKEIVDHPDDVKTERRVDEMGVLITLHVNPQDMGQVIGRSGQTARALRTILRAVGAKNNARVNLKIHEPEGSIRPPRREQGGVPAAAPVAAAAAAPAAAAPRELSQEEVDAAVGDLDL